MVHEQNISHDIRYYILIPTRRLIKILDGADDAIKGALGGLHHTHGWTVHMHWLYSDHVEVHISTPPAVSPHFIFVTLKKAIDKAMRAFHPERMRGKSTIWTSAYMVSTSAIAADDAHQFLGRERIKKR